MQEAFRGLQYIKTNAGDVTAFPLFPEFTCPFTVTPFCKHSSVHLSFLHLQQTPHSPSTRKASHSNPHPHFQNCTQSDVMMVHCGLGSFCKKNNCILLVCNVRAPFTLAIKCLLLFFIIDQEGSLEQAPLGLNQQFIWA